MRRQLFQAMASSVDTCRRIWRHPENSGRRARTIAVYFAWQAWERTIKRPWVITLAPNRRIRCYPHCAVSSGTLYYRLPERSSMRFLLDYLTPGEVMVDVGANLGTYSLLATTIDGVTAFAFEPSSLAYGRAIQNVELNGLGDRIQVLPQAVGATNGEAVLTVGLGPRNRIIDATSRWDDTGTRTSPRGEHVSVITLDEAFPISPAPIRLVKIDVEGGEVDVLEGARHLIQRDAPALIVEVNDPVRLERVLADLEYSCYVYNPDAARLRPTTVYDHLNRNVIAIADRARLEGRGLSR